MTANSNLSADCGDETRIGVYVSSERNSNGEDMLEIDCECPVCLTHMKPPIYQCFNGHVVCQDCEKKIESCPVCRGEYVENQKIRCLFLEKIVVGLKVYCKYREDGCLFKGTIVDCQNHSRVCDHRKFPFCSYLGFSCDKKLRREEVLNHIKSAHLLLGVKHGIHGNLKCRSEKCPVTFCLCNPIQFMFAFEIPKAGINIEDGDKLGNEIKTYVATEEGIFFMRFKHNPQKNCCSWTISVLRSGTRSRKYSALIRLLPVYHGQFLAKRLVEVVDIERELLDENDSQPLIQKKKQLVVNFDDIEKYLGIRNKSAFKNLQAQYGKSGKSREHEVDVVDLRFDLCLFQCRNESLV